jgi:hypothetical protein
LLGGSIVERECNQFVARIDPTDGLSGQCKAARIADAVKGGRRRQKSDYEQGRPSDGSPSESHVAPPGV